MCNSDPNCISCLNEKIDKLTISVQSCNDKLDKIDKVLNNYDGIIVRVSYIESVLSKASWIIGVMFTSIAAILVKIIFKV